MKSRETDVAFRWIIGLLKEKNIPFQIAGGLAARIYGSPRELADIDIGIPDDRFSDICESVREYLTFGPAHYTDEEWDLELMTLVYKGQEIDIASEDTIRLYDKNKRVWATGRCDFSDFELKEIYGMTVPVIPLKKLIAHKKLLMRSVDMEDVRALELMHRPNN